MSDRNITAEVKEFYRKYHFPGDRPLDRDGLIFTRHFANSIKSIQCKRVRVLDAGCGTGNSSAALASEFSDAEFFAVDQSSASLKKAKKLCSESGINNLKFTECNLLNPLPFKFKFDIIICLGVLHHTADMKNVLLNLSQSLKNSGELYLWIYAKTGRYRHSLNMKLLEMLINARPRIKDEISFTKKFVTGGEGSILFDLTGTSQTYLLKTKAAEDPVWIADQFLNPHEELISMEQLINLVQSAGLRIEKTLGMNEDVNKFFESAEVAQRFNKLKGNKKLIALDLLYKPEHYFVKLRKSKLRV